MAAPEQDLQKVVSMALTVLDKAVRQFQLYGRNHPQFASAMKDLQARMAEVLTARKTLDLTIKRTEFEWEGKAVFEVTKRDNNYIQQMYVDGVRRIEFLPAISQDEFQEFIAILGRDILSYDSREDDTVTMLWKKGLTNIRTETIDIYASDRLAFLEDQLSKQDSEEDEKADQDYFEKIVYRLLGYETAGGDPGPSGHASPHHQSLAKEASTPAPETAFEISDGDRETLQKEIIDLPRRDYFTEVALVFCEVLEFEAGSPYFPTLLTAYRGRIVDALKQMDLSRASDWLKRLRGVQARIGQSDVSIHGAIEDEICAVFDPELFRMLGEKVSKGAHTNPRDWTQLFFFFGRNKAEAVCELLSGIEQEAFHSAMREFLVEQAPDRTDVFLHYLKHSAPQLVRNMVRILGQLLPPSVLESSFVHVAAHPASEVRGEVIRVVSTLSGDFSAHVLKRALTDTDRSLRLLTLGILARNPDLQYAKPLAGQVKQEDFNDRDFEEKKQTVVALARCGGEATLDFLKQMVTEGSSNTPAQEELRIAALHGIAEVPGPDSETILREWAEKSFFQKTLRDVARRLLERRAAPAREEGTE